MTNMSIVTKRAPCQGRLVNAMLHDCMCAGGEGGIGAVAFHALHAGAYKYLLDYTMAGVSLMPVVYGVT